MPGPIRNSRIISAVQNIRGQMDEAIAMGNKHMCHFDTIREVCEYMGIDEDGLKKTLEKYNKAAETGIDEEFKTNPKYIKPVREANIHRKRLPEPGVRRRQPQVVASREEEFRRKSKIFIVRILLSSY